MTPDEIRAWQQQHGGDAGADPPDANGITVYRAADGSFINVRRDGSLAMRGSGPPRPATADGAQAPAAPARGIGMDQSALEALLARMGSLGPNDFREETKQEDIPNPASTANGGLDPNAPLTVKGPVVYRTWVKPGTNQRLTVKVNADGSYTQQYSGADPAIKTGDEPGTAIGSRQETDAQGRTTKVTTYRRSDGTTYTREDSVQAAPEKPQVVAGTLNTTSPQYAVVGPDGSVTWAPNPNYQNPSPKPITLPNTRTVTWADADGTLRTEKNPHYVKPSKLIPHPADPRRMVNVTEDDDGNPVILPVDDQTTIKPADLPVLQSKYGEIAQGLAALAQDLNRKYAAGEITAEERKDAFTAGHAQASTQVAELNSILDNSKAIWSGQVSQRGQTLSETQSRRSFASDAAGRAIQAGSTVAAGALPGHGKEIVAGVEALMRMQQRYAAGMGGFRESPEVGLPPALEQARGIGLPGYPMPAAAGGLPAGPSGPGGAPGAVAGPGGPGGSPTPPNALGVGAIGSLPAPGGAPPSGISNTTDAGGVPREYTPASSTVGPPMAGMGAALEGAQAYAGAPVAAGGAGLWDPSLAMQGMLGQGGDPAWEEAVRRAAAGFGRVR